MISATVENTMFLIKRAKKPLEVRVHKTISGAECYRIVDANKNPICNISRAVLESLIRRDIIKDDRSGITGTPTLFNPTTF